MNSCREMVKTDMGYPKKPLPPTKLLRSILTYRKDTGELIWKRRAVWTFRKECPLGVVKGWNAQFPGRRAFYTPNESGHLNGYINGMPYLAHRIIWKIVTGKDPDFIDHKDGNPSNNKWSNLREGGAQMNAKNQAIPSQNTSGIMGVHWHSTNKRWTANIRVEGRLKHLGTFESKEAAAKARIAAEKKHGYHPNHGKRLRCLG